MNDKRKPADTAIAAADVPRGSQFEDVADGAADLHVSEQVRLYAGDDAVAVLLTRERAGGVVAVGAMKPGVVYFVGAQEARRLVRAKRFQYATPADRDRAIALDAPVSETAAVVSPALEGGGPLDADRHRGGTPVTRDEE